MSGGWPDWAEPEMRESGASWVEHSLAGDPGEGVAAHEAEPEWALAPPRWPGWAVSRWLLVGDSPAMRETFDAAAGLAASDAAALVTGSAGTGKYTLARMIHAASVRRDGPFIPLHCGAQPSAALGEALFGGPIPDDTPLGTRLHARKKPKRWSAARGGTLFLQHIEYAEPWLQERVAGAMLDGFFPADDDLPRGSVRVLVSSTWPFPDLVRFQRLVPALIPLLRRNRLHIPPLSERDGDIPSLAAFLLDRHARDLQRRAPAIEPDALASLHRPLRANVSELDDLLRHALAACGGPTLRLADFTAPLV